MIVTWWYSDMEFVQKFTPPDFQAENFTPSILPNFNSFSGNKHKKWVKMEKFTLLTKILHSCRDWRDGQIPPLAWKSLWDQKVFPGLSMANTPNCNFQLPQWQQAKTGFSDEIALPLILDVWNLNRSSTILNCLIMSVHSCRRHVITW